MKTKTNLLVAGIFLAAVFNGFGQMANKSPHSRDGMWQAVQRIDANAPARSTFYRTVQP